MMNKNFLLCLLVVFSSWFKVGNELEPQVAPVVSEAYLKSLPSPFRPLSYQEQGEPWGYEHMIAMQFAHNLDLYNAKTTFQRASFLIPKEEKKRLLELNYDILLCYYLGEKYSDALYLIENSPLRHADPSFTPYHDLLLITYDAYHKQNDYRSDIIMQFIEKHYPQTASQLKYAQYLSTGDLAHLSKLAETSPDINDVLVKYRAEKKSTFAAQLLNTVFPGSGYLYLGQKQSAMTSFLLNGLFIWGSWYAFDQGHTALGVILAGFESGWYFGGIYGAGLEAKLYNERIYEKIVTPVMNQKKYFPVLMLHYGF